MGLLHLSVSAIGKEDLFCILTRRDKQVENMNVVEKDENWNIGLGKIQQLTVLNSATALWGIPKSYAGDILVEADKIDVGRHRLSSGFADLVPSTSGEELEEDEEEKLKSVLRMLQALVLVSRSENDQLFAAMSALNAVAHSKFASVRKAFIDLCDDESARRLAEVILIDDKCFLPFAFGLSILCGILETCFLFTCAPDAVLPTLKPTFVMKHCKHSPKDEEIVTSRLAFGAVMFFLLNLQSWSCSDTEILVQLLRMKDTVLVGSNLTCVAVSLWSLCRNPNLRQHLLSQTSCLQNLVTCGLNSLQIVKVYEESDKTAEANLKSFQHLKLKTQKTISQFWTQESRLHPEKSRVHNLKKCLEHVQALNGVLAALWTLISNRKIFELVASSDFKSEEMFLRRRDLISERKAVKHSFQGLLSLILEIIELGAFGKLLFFGPISPD